MTLTGDKPGRFWRYRYGAWSPGFWGWFLPYFGGDEYGRRTIVQHLPTFGFVVWAFRTCRCDECGEVREQTAQWEAEEAEEAAAEASVRAGLIRLQTESIAGLNGYPSGLYDPDAKVPRVPKGPAAPRGRESA